jgi:cyclic-di-AMP phosphodiesterase PgpH
MSTGSKKKRRIDRVTSVELPPGVLGNLWGQLRRGHVLVRIALCAITALLLWSITRGWAPPMPYHWGDVPQRDIVARTEFALEDERKTEDARKEARRLAIATYDHDPAQLDQLRAKVENDVTAIVAAKSLADVDKICSRLKARWRNSKPRSTKSLRPS